MRLLSGAKFAAVVATGLLLAGCGSGGGGAPQTIDVGKPTTAVGSTKNTPPAIEGAPLTAVTIGSAYSFQPRGSDAEGDAIRFEIANKPAWMAFDTATGRLSGTPTANDAGIYANIRITASDGKSSTALPAFSVTVVRASTDPAFDKDADFAARVAYSKAWYANNFGDYASLEDLLRDHGLSAKGDVTVAGSRAINTDPQFSLSGGKSFKSTMTPTARQGGNLHVDFYKWAPAGPQKDGDSVREFYLQYTVYWTREALAWTHRDAQKGEGYKTLLLEGYGPGQIQPGMQRRLGVVTAEVNGRNGCTRNVKTSSVGNLWFVQSSLHDPAVTVNAASKLEDYIAKYGLTYTVRDNTKWGYVASAADWSYKGRWETGGDWTRNLIDHPDRGHPYGGWGWPELKKPADHTPWVKDGWTVVEIYVRQDPTVIGYSAEGKPQYNPQTFRVWAAPYGEAPRLLFDSTTASCDLAYKADNYKWFRLLYYDTNIVEAGGFGAKVDARMFQPTATEFEIVYEPGADDKPKGHPFYAHSVTGDKTVGTDHEFVGNRIGWNIGTMQGQLFTILDSRYIGLVQDGVDAAGQPVMKRKTRLTVEPMAGIPVGGTGNAEGFVTEGDYLQVQTFAEEGYRPPLDIYYDELLMSYEPIPFPGHLDKPLPAP
jgi:hypothetical protein